MAANVGYPAPDQLLEDGDRNDRGEGDAASDAAFNKSGAAIAAAILLAAILIWWAMRSTSTRPEWAADHIILAFNCSDNASSFTELESCHEERAGALSHEIEEADLPPEVKENEGAFSDFLLSNYRGYFFGGSVNVTEYIARLKTFSDTLRLIDERNAAAAASGLSNPARHGVTKFADWTAEEFADILGGQASSEERLRRRRLRELQDSSVHDAEDSEREAMRRLADTTASCNADWSARGQIRNQGGCGNCWTFSTAEAIRSATIQQTGKDPGALSTQYITDCMRITSCKGGVNGCCGGNPGDAMLWLQEQGGIPTREAYGDIYTAGEVAPSVAGGSVASSPATGPVSEAGDGTTFSGNSPHEKFACKKGIEPAVQLAGNRSDEESRILKTEADMESYVCGTGSLSIMVDAHAWQTYHSGVMDAKRCGTKIDHAVLLIGVNQDENAWLVQNSWGYDWGMNTSGAPAPKDKYWFCAHLAGKDKKGCTLPLKHGRTVADVCQATCDENPTKGGYIWVQFGANACDITCEAIRVPNVELV